MLDKLEIRTYNFQNYQVTKPGNFVRPLRSMGKNWHSNNTGKYLPGYHPQVVINRYPAPVTPTSTLQALEVSFSAPKVLYGNNLYELQDKNFLDVCKALSSKLGSMGVTITSQTIANMDVRSIEYSKNILTRNIPVEYILTELYRGGIKDNNYLNVSHTTYQNGGVKLAFFCQKYDIVFYDKSSEILQELQSNPTILPPNVVQELKSGTSNILRMEVRFKSAQALKDFIVTKHQLTTATKLRNVFSQAISQYVLTYFWNELSQSARQVLPFVLGPGLELWQIHKRGRRTMGTQKALAKLGMRYLLREQGYNGARRALERIKCSNPPTYIRQYTTSPFIPLQKLNMWQFIDGALRRFTCLNAKKWQTFKAQSRGAWFYKQEWLLTVSEVAAWLNVGEQVVRRAIRKKELRAKKTPVGWRISRYAVFEYLYAGV